MLEVQKPAPGLMVRKGQQRETAMPDLSLSLVPSKGQQNEDYRPGLRCDRRIEGQVTAAPRNEDGSGVMGAGGAAGDDRNATGVCSGACRQKLS